LEGAVASWIRTLVLIGSLLALSAHPAASDESAKRSLALEVMTLTGATSGGDQLGEGMMAILRPAYPAVPEEIWAKLEATISLQEIIDLSVPIYMRHFNEEELAELIAFYKSSIGRKMIERMPMVMQEGTRVGAEWRDRKLAEAVVQLEAAGYEPKGPAR
jgi:hypothetical protein